MKYRVRFVRITMDITSTITLALWALATIVSIVFITVVTIGGMVTYTMLTPRLVPIITAYYVVIYPVAIVGVFATGTMEGIVLPTILAP
jgi:uncharacterized membrane protein